MKTQFRIEKKEMETSNGTSFVAYCYRATPKGRMNEKIEFAYRFKTEASREEYIAKFLESQEKYETEREAIKQAKKDAKKNMVNPFKVGDIVYDSWGYDQTNIDFYQVVEVGAKSVKIREIAAKYLESAGFMCEYVAPDKDNFTGEAETKILQISGNKPLHNLTSRLDKPLG